MARKKANRVSIDTMAQNIAKGSPYKADDCRNIIRMFIKEIERQIKDGHNVALGRLGYMDARWVKPHPVGKHRTICKGHYVMRFKYAIRLKRFIRGLEEGDFDYPYVEMYPNEIVTENGILRKRREDEEFFND